MRWAKRIHRKKRRINRSLNECIRFYMKLMQILLFVFLFFSAPHHPFNSGFCSIFRAKHSLRIHRICIFKNTLICTRPNCFNRFESICQPHCIPIDIFSAVAHTTRSPANIRMRMKQMHEFNGSVIRKEIQRIATKWLRPDYVVWLTDLLAHHPKTCVRNKSFETLS